MSENSQGEPFGEPGQDNEEFGPDTEAPDLEDSESVPSDSMTEAQMEAVIEDLRFRISNSWEI